MAGKALYRFIISVTSLLCADLVNASIGLGSCEMSCSQNEDLVPRSNGPQGPPGKRGPMGIVGLPGSIGPRGPPGECTRCGQLVEETRILKSSIAALQERLYPRDCVDVKKFAVSSGIYVIYPSGGTTYGVLVYCDHSTDGGGWTVIQRRMDGSENFFRDWNAYVAGFGAKEREFWLGLEAMYRIAANQSHELRFDFVTKTGEKLYAKYSVFKLAPGDDNYRITVDGYTGNAGNSMLTHNGREFTTTDRDNDAWPDGNSATTYKGAWWYTYGHHANLNGLYDGSSSNGMSWYKWKNSWATFLRIVEMKIRRRE